MRRYLVPIALLASLGPLGCEDGPTQPFQAAPSGAGANWNNGNSAPFSDPGVDAGFTIPSAGGSKVEICTGDKKHMVWAEMLAKPVIPPTTAAGINMAGTDAMGNVDWHGITVDEAEKINCQSDVYGDLFGDGNLDNTWGDNGEVSFEYRISTRKILQINLWPGYVGKMDFKCTDTMNPDKCPYGSHTYQIGVQSQVTRDGKPFTIDWVGNGGKNFVPQGDELYHALMFTYQPQLPTDPAGVTCRDTGKCIKGSFGDVAYFYIPSLGWAFWVDNQNAAQPVPSIATRLDVFPVKVFGFSYANPTLKMDKEGPIAVTDAPLGVAKTPCKLALGLKYSDYLSTCVQVTGDATTDKNELNKLLGGMSHGTERFSFDIQGVDINFTDLSLPVDDIVHDTDTPHPNDYSTSFVVDQSTLGKLLNDYYFDANSKAWKRDLHGTGALYKEFARLTRQNLLALANIPDGDTTKCVFPAGWVNDPNFDPNAFMASLPPYCTGFEWFITPAPSTGKNDWNNIGYVGAATLNSQMALGLKLGHQKVTFCADANGTDYAMCDAPYGAQGDTFATSFAVVQRVFGKGKLSNLPTEVQDVRFFFKMWVQSLIKYLMFEGTAPNPVPDLAQFNIDPDDLFFDSIGAGQFELAEYVDRRFASKTQDPTDFVFEADVKNGIQDGYVWSRDLFRGETALYTSMLVDSVNDAPGQEENGLLTNIFGSPILKAGWAASSKGKSAYYCATHLDPGNCDGQLPPVDGNFNMLVDSLGRPILAGYPGAFGATVFALGPTAVAVTKTYDNIQQAMINVPLYKDPYNTTAKGNGLAPQQWLVPWTPKQPGIGFPLALSGTLDKFIETSQLDLSGTTITANIDYDLIIDPATGQPKKGNPIEFLAVETTDFLGDVFLCQDADTGDLLSARMYTPVANILTWLQTHPKSYASCGIIVRYSPFGNYADYITSLTGGVRLGVTQGGGFGRIVDATLFVPGQ